MKPMLCGSIDLNVIDKYLTDNEWVAQQKLDGDRLVVRVRDGVVSALNRVGEPRSNPVPGVVLRQFQVFPDEWVFDGELLTTGEYWLFDLPYAGGLVHPHQPYSLRCEVLERIFSSNVWQPDPCIRLLPVARSTTAKQALFNGLKARGAEGLIFRHVDSEYLPGKRSALALKAKFTHTADVVVHEVRPEGRNNCTFRVFRDGVLVPAGSCSLEGRPRVAPGDVIEVRYLYASDDARLYQPTMLRARDDKLPSECTIDQFHFTDRTVMPSTGYVRQCLRSQSVGVEVRLLDAAHPDSEYSVRGGRWVTVCEHGSAAHHDRYKVARRARPHPDRWCATCRESLRARVA